MGHLNHKGSQCYFQGMQEDQHMGKEQMGEEQKGNLMENKVHSFYCHLTLKVDTLVVHMTLTVDKYLLGHKAVQNQT